MSSVRCTDYRYRKLASARLQIDSKDVPVAAQLPRNRGPRLLDALLCGDSIIPVALAWPRPRGAELAVKVLGEEAESSGRGGRALVVLDGAYDYYLRAKFR